MTQLTLYSKRSCPYVQRVMIGLAEKGASYTLTYLDAGEKPDWFRQLSPLGKVPLLKVSRPDEPDIAIFESMVILEFIDEGLPGSRLHPADPVLRAQARSWMELGSAMLPEVYGIWMAKSEQDFVAARDKVIGKLDHIEDNLSDGPYFEGLRFSCVDVVFAPLFNKLEVFESLADVGLLENFPKIRAWSSALEVRTSVRETRMGEQGETLVNALNLKEAYAMKHLAA